MRSSRALAAAGTVSMALLTGPGVSDAELRPYHAGMQFSVPMVHAQGIPSHAGVDDRRYVRAAPVHASRQVVQGSGVHCVTIKPENQWDDRRERRQVPKRLSQIVGGVVGFAAGKAAGGGDLVRGGAAVAGAALGGAVADDRYHSQRYGREEAERRAEAECDRLQGTRGAGIKVWELTYTDPSTGQVETAHFKQPPAYDGQGRPVVYVMGSAAQVGGVAGIGRDAPTYYPAGRNVRQMAYDPVGNPFNDGRLPLLPKPVEGKMAVMPEPVERKKPLLPDPSEAAANPAPDFSAAFAASGDRRAKHYGVVDAGIMRDLAESPSRRMAAGAIKDHGVAFPGGPGYQSAATSLAQSADGRQALLHLDELLPELLRRQEAKVSLHAFIYAAREQWGSEINPFDGTAMDNVVGAVPGNWRLAQMETHDVGFAGAVGRYREVFEQAQNSDLDATRTAMLGMDALREDLAQTNSAFVERALWEAGIEVTAEARAQEAEQVAAAFADRHAEQEPGPSPLATRG